MIALAFWANRLPAQEAIGPPGRYAPDVIGPPGGIGVVVVPAVPYEPDRLGSMPPPFAPRPAPPPAAHRLQHLFNQHGLSCASNVPGGACGNVHYDFHFVFGSCRWFFGEQCYPNTHGNGYGYGSGNGYGNCGPGGCKR